jgi:WD40 repeat protein
MRLIPILASLAITILHGISSAFAASPNIVWEVPTPSGLANSIQGVGWSPAGRVAVGSTDRWVRTRQSTNGALIYSVLQPIRSGGANETIYSKDGLYLAVHNRTAGLGYRVLRAADGVFLGMLTVTIDSNGLVRFAPDAQLISSVGGDGTLSNWRINEFTVVLTVGSGYDRTSTTFNFSPNGVYQSAASVGSIKIQRRTDGATIRVFSGGALKGFTPVNFTPNSSAIAVWASNPNQTILWRISDGAVLKRFPGAKPQEGVVAIRFTPDGARLVTTGYLPYEDADGLWQQVGIIRFWRVSDGALRQQYDEHTGIGVTSPIAWSPDLTSFAYGTYEGTAVAARTPAP